MILSIRNILVIPLMLLMLNQVFAQFNAQQSMGAFQPMSINPAFSTLHDALHVQMQYRSMWTGIEGAPKTTSFNSSAALIPKKIYGTLQFESDQLGLFRTNKVLLGAATKLKIKKGHYFSFGLQIGIDMNTYRADQVVLSTMADQSVTFETTRSSIFQMSTGLMYKAPTWYIAASVPRMMQRAYNGGGTWRADHEVKAYNYHLQFAKAWDLTRDWKLSTGLLTKKIVSLTHQTEVYSTIENKAINVGLGYRHKDAILFLLKWKVNDQLSINYVYDHPANAMRLNSQASHEWMLGYIFSYNNRTPSPRSL